MTLSELLVKLPPRPLGDLPFPRPLLGAFRRKSISFCTGVTDETTIVYWFQSRSFTIDLRLPDAAATPVAQRQGWIGDTLWDAETEQLSWEIATSYQPRNQWPEPARLGFIGNAILEYAPSGAYVEDWRQQVASGPFLGLRLMTMRDGAAEPEIAMEGGFVLAGDHAAFACARPPSVEQALRGRDSIHRAMEDGTVTAEEVESYEVSVATGGSIVTHTTQSDRMGRDIVPGLFTLDRDGTVLLTMNEGLVPRILRFSVDTYIPDFRFDCSTAATPEALRWLEREKDHLARHAVISR